MLRELALLIIKRSAKFLLLAALVSRPAVAQDFAHGTFFIFELSTDYAVVAIDSRSTITPKNGQIRFNDGVCKIRPLAPNAFFFSTGLDRVFHETTEREFFDARDTASDAYANAGRPPNFETLTDKWATWMETSFRHARLSPEALKDTMTKGFFVGIKDNGDLTADAATIGYHADSAAQFTHTPENFTATAKPSLEQPVDKPLIDIESEFANGGQTDRAKKVMQDTGWATAGNGPDTTALHLSTLVTAVRDWSGNDKIGGDIATIILERGKPWRWFHRPDFCPQQKAAQAAVPSALVAPAVPPARGSAPVRGKPRGSSGQ
jgi:hypothetical protein